MTISFLLHKYRLNNWLILCLSNLLVLVDLTWCDLDQRESSWDICESKLLNLCAQVFNFKIIVLLIVLEIFVASKVFTFCWAMSRRSLVGEIRCPAARVKYVAVSYTVRLWDSGHNGYLWVHPSVVINISSGSGNISTTIQTFEGKAVSIAVSWYGWFVGVDNG